MHFFSTEKENGTLALNFKCSLGEKILGIVTHLHEGGTAENRKSE